MHHVSMALLASATAIGLALPAVAADTLILSPGSVVETSKGTWDGAFFGVFAGSANGPSTDTYSSVEIYPHDLSGGLVGVTVGTNFTHANGLVFGVVGDFAGSDVGATEAVGIGLYNIGVNWAGSLRARVGINTGSFLPYLTAGLAVADVTSEYVQGGVVRTTDSNTHVGWTVGVGVEAFVANNVSLDLLYRYSDYGAMTYNRGLRDYDIELSTNQVSVGLNFKF